MSNVGLSMQQSPSGGKPGQPPKSRRKRSGVAVFLAVLVVMVAVAGLAYGAYYGYQRFSDAQPGADYPGPGSGEVVIEVTKGQSLTDIGTTLKEADVVASTQAFIEAADANARATNVTPGSYVMLKQMPAADAIERLLNPSSRNENQVTITEGLRVNQIVATLSDATGIKPAEFAKVLNSPTLLPLPSWAKGTGPARAEGFLFPATYQFEKGMTARQILNAMVAKFNQVTTEINFVERSQQMGFSPFEVLTIASLIQAEAHPEDFGKVSRVIHNRLNPKTWGGTYGKLELDATINYALNASKTDLTKSDLQVKSAYNTRRHMGLPPTPIDSPGQAAMEAALNPPEGPWLWYATVNLDTGETKFTDDYQEFLRFEQELRDWEAENS